MDRRQRWENLAAGFAVLGRFHREAPDEGALRGVTGLLDEWPLAGTEPAERGLALLRASAGAGEDVATIAADRARLYGEAALAVVAPYESVHRSKDHLVFERHTLQARAAYRRLNLQAPHLNREPDDHIGLEFDFMAQALLRALDDADPALGLSAATDFLHDRLLPWAPGMLAKLETAASTRFMAGLAALSLGALESASADLLGEGSKG